MTDPILALDQRAVGNRAIVFNAQAQIVALVRAEFPQPYPAKGWVERDPEAAARPRTLLLE